MAIIDNFSEQQLKTLVQESFYMKDLAQKLGYASKSNNIYNTIKSRLDKYNIDYSHIGKTNKSKFDDDQVFCNNSCVSQSTLRSHFLQKKEIIYECSICKQPPIWNDKELVLTLDHIDGNNTNNELTNLRWVCPNCDRQLETYAGRNIKNKINESLRIRDREGKLCPMCNKNVIVKHSNQCKECYYKK